MTRRSRRPAGGTAAQTAAASERVSELYEQIKDLIHHGRVRVSEHGFDELSEDGCDRLSPPSVDLHVLRLGGIRIGHSHE